MDRDILLKVFEAGSMPLTLEEIEKIMDEEMAKDPSEMDGDLVEACLDILTKATAGNKEKSEPEKNEDVKGKKRIKLKKIFMFAAIIAVLLGLAVPVFGKYIRSEASESVVKYNANHFEVDLSGENNADNYSDESFDIIKVLNEKGFDNVVLPAELLKEEYVKTFSGYIEDDQFITVSISFNNKTKGIYGNIGITKHNSETIDFLIGQIYSSGDYDSVKQLFINGMDILVLSNNKRSYIVYVDNIYEYHIEYNNCNLDSAVEIANTLE